MPYLKKTIVIRDVVIVKKYFSLRHGKKIFRSSNSSKTSEKQKEINRKRADEKRMYLILNNFECRDGLDLKKADRFITLTYARGARPTGFDEAHNNFRRVLKKIKRKYPNCKYMGKTEMPPSGAVHHHLLITRDVPHDFIVECWVEFNSYIQDKPVRNLNTFKLQSYFVKNESSHKVTESKYIQSRNLKKPIEKVEVIASKKWRAEPSGRKGFNITEVQNYFDAFGFPCQRYFMLRI